MPTYPTPQPIALVVDMEVGTVRVDASDRTATAVEVRPSDPSRAADVKAAEETQVDLAGTRLHVRGPSRRFVGPGVRSGSIDVRVELPAGSALQVAAAATTVRSSGRLGDCAVKTAMGDIDLEQTSAVVLRSGFGRIAVVGVAGDADVSTASGEVHLGSVAGTATVKNSNGRTTIGDVGGDLRVKAANGDISVGHTAADVVATSARGDVRVESLERGIANLKTALGEIELGLAADSAARLDLHTSFGTVRTLLERADGPDGAGRTVEVRARTAMGDIVVRRARARA